MPLVYRAVPLVYFDSPHEGESSVLVGGIEVLAGRGFPLAGDNEVLAGGDEFLVGEDLPIVGEKAFLVGGKSPFVGGRAAMPGSPLSQPTGGHLSGREGWLKERCVLLGAAEVIGDVMHALREIGPVLGAAEDRAVRRRVDALRWKREFLAHDGDFQKAEPD